MTENQAPQLSFGLEKIYLKDVSYEAPGAPGVFLLNQPPEVEMHITLAHRPVQSEQGYYEVTLTVQVNAKTKGQPLFLVEVQQGGVFRLQGVNGDALERALQVDCAHVLLPFAREAVNDMVGKGGFPQLLVNPIDFDGLYEQKRSKAQQPAHGQA